MPDKLFIPGVVTTPVLNSVDANYKILVVFM